MIRMVRLWIYPYHFRKKLMCQTSIKHSNIAQMKEVVAEREHQNFSLIPIYRSFSLLGSAKCWNRHLSAVDGLFLSRVGCTVKEIETYMSECNRFICIKHKHWSTSFSHEGTLNTIHHRQLQSASKLNSAGKTFVIFCRLLLYTYWSVVCSEGYLEAPQVTSKPPIATVMHTGKDGCRRDKSPHSQRLQQSRLLVYRGFRSGDCLHSQIWPASDKKRALHCSGTLADYMPQEFH